MQPSYLDVSSECQNAMLLTFGFNSWRWQVTTHTTLVFQMVMKKILSPPKAQINDQLSFLKCVWGLVQCFLQRQVIKKRRLSQAWMTWVRGLTPIWVTTDVMSKATWQYQVGSELATMPIGCDVMDGNTLVLSRKWPYSNRILSLQKVAD